MSALEIHELVVEYDRRGDLPVRAVAGASVDVDRGQIVGLVGESGCGKSTLARAAVGMVAPTSGTVRFEGHDVRPLTRGARPRELSRLQMVFQNPFSSRSPRSTPPRRRSSPTCSSRSRAISTSGSYSSPTTCRSSATSPTRSP
jgi:peptide/nickel transport system ATP-binding protein